jgi:transposase
VFELLPLVQKVSFLEQRVKELEAQLHKNSHNSHKPPSADGMRTPKRTQSLRRPSERPPGGQEGHEGTTLKMRANPDTVIRHRVRRCCRCCHSMKGVDGSVDRRQVWEVEIRVRVTEHQAEIKECLVCGTVNRAAFPSDVNAPVSYGPGVCATALYLMNQQFIPYERVADVFRDLFSLPLSAGTVFEMNRRCFENLADVSEAIQEGIVASDVAHFDETGLNLSGQSNWLHSASTERLTYYDVHAKRGKEALEDIGILSRFRGRAVHDHWASYFDYTGCSHSLCNAHHLRELTFVIEQESETWAAQMKDLLLEMHQAVEERRKKGAGRLSPRLIRTYEERYERILQKGLRHHRRLPPLLQQGTRGRKKQRPGKNLLDRLQNNRMEVLAFIYDFSIPFTNNLAERDIRMNKLKQKISGCFRSLQGAQFFCRIRGYISTVRKQGWNILRSLELAVRGFPPLPSPAT